MDTSTRGLAAVLALLVPALCLAQTVEGVQPAGGNPWSWLWIPLVFLSIALLVLAARSSGRGKPPTRI
jgi:hypothetical protein